MLSCACCSKQLGDQQRRACTAGRALGRWNTCGGCKAAGVREAPVYCDAVCQKAHWRSHRQLCGAGKAAMHSTGSGAGELCVAVEADEYDAARPCLLGTKLISRGKGHLKLLEQGKHHSLELEQLKNGSAQIECIDCNADHTGARRRCTAPRRVAQPTVARRRTRARRHNVGRAGGRARRGGAAQQLVRRAPPPGKLKELRAYLVSLGAGADVLDGWRAYVEGGELIPSAPAATSARPWQSSSSRSARPTSSSSTNRCSSPPSSR